MKNTKCTTKNFLNCFVLKFAPILSICFFAIFLISCVLFVFINNWIFPLISFSSGIALLFINHGKNRIYFLVFSILFSKLLAFSPLKLGSLETLLVIIYESIIILEIAKKKLRIGHIKNCIMTLFKKYFLFLFFIIIIMIFSILSGQFNGLKSGVSFLCYFLLPFFFYFDNKANKNFETCLSFFVFSFFVTNLICVLIYYVIKGDMAITFLSRFLEEVYVIQYRNSALTFRYPGLIGDPNYLGMYVLFITMIYVISFKNLKHKFFLLPFIIFFQLLAFLGESKNYLLMLVLILFFLFIVFCFKSKNTISKISISIIICSMVMLLFLLPITTPVIKRLFIIDSRNGFLDAVTTTRTTLQKIYLDYFLQEPMRLFVGSGAVDNILSVGGAHNIYIMSVWYFGLFGAVAYLLILKKCAFFYYRSNVPCILLIPLLIPIFYGFSLDFVLSCHIFIIELFIFSLSINNYFKKNVQQYEIEI